MAFGLIAGRGVQKIVIDLFNNNSKAKRDWENEADDITLDYKRPMVGAGAEGCVERTCETKRKKPREAQEARARKQERKSK